MRRELTRTQAISRIPWGYRLAATASWSDGCLTYTHYDTMNPRDWDISGSRAYRSECTETLESSKMRARKRDCVVEVV